MSDVPPPVASDAISRPRSALGLLHAVRAPQASLARRVFLINAAVLAAVGLVLLLTPLTVSDPVALREAVVLISGLALMMLVNLVVLRRAFAPLDRLATSMRRVDLLRPGARVDVHGSAPDIQALATTFNEMLERLEDERRQSARAALLAQESERRRVGQELHDELGQSLTGLLLQLDDATDRHAGDPELEEARETARHSLEQVRSIARALRPDALDDLGLASAISTLCNRFARQTGIPVHRHIEPHLPTLTREVDVVVYRVAQESLTNVARHAGAGAVDLRLARRGDDVVLTVTDDGAGIAREVKEGAGIRGMRERALLARGQLTIEADHGVGTTVRLRVPREFDRDG